MSPELRERLPARVTFVVGKGGVGKTTSSGALALAFADGTHRTHLLSTDPAHSVGDLFGEALPPGAGPTPSPCSPLLTLEEMDAPALGRSWIRRMEEPLAELVDLGTYLDREDVASFLGLALPGVDEFMGALRLTELDDAPELERIVVDTAPTGHTLRLLDSHRLLEGWVRALDAMAEKAGAVGERLLRRRFRLRGEEIVDELRARITRFEERVVGSADILVVSRSDEVVLQETRRLIGWMRRRGLRVAAELRVEAPGRHPPPPADEQVPLWRVPWQEGLRGCEGLRRWRMAMELSPMSSSPSPGPLAPSSPTKPHGDAGEPVAGRGPEPMETAARGVLEHFGREILFFTGKGGVGKSTCATACALALSDRSPVLLLSTDPAGSLGEILREAPDEARLQVRQVEAEREFQALRDRYRESIRELFERLGLDHSAHLDRKVLESLPGLAPPGVDEIFALHALLEERGGRVLVVDTAPTGHFLRLMEMPRIALDWTRAVLRLLRKYRHLLNLDEPVGELLEFARNLRSLLELLQDPARTGVVIVTLDSPVVLAETRRLRHALEGGAIPLLALIYNRQDPEAPSPPLGRGEEPDRWGWAGVTVMTAPLLTPPPVGRAALLHFFSHWELVR